jgi:hypothetical protein
MAAWFRAVGELRGTCACAEVVTPEIVGGVVIKGACCALEELAAVRKHANMRHPTAECSLRRRKARRPRLKLRWVVDFAVFIVFVRFFLFK